MYFQLYSFSYMRYRVLFILVFNVLFAFSQEVTKVKKKINSTTPDIRGILYTDMHSGSIGIASNGYLLNYRRHWLGSVFYHYGFEVDLGILQHEKEVAVESNIYSGQSSYIYGRLNSLYSLRLGFGMDNRLIPKREIGAVKLSYHYYGGLSLGITIPTYLKVNVNYGMNKHIKSKIEKYDPNKHSNQEMIMGGTFFLRGIGDLAIHPGIYGKAGLSFEYSPIKEKIYSVEIGALCDYYFKEIPIMHDAKNYSYYFAFYVSLNYGKKWIH